MLLEEKSCIWALSSDVMGAVLLSPARLQVWERAQHTSSLRKLLHSLYHWRALHEHGATTNRDCQW